jgi:hypothetical protein
MSEHLGHDKNAPVTNPDGNARNGKSKKTLKGKFFLPMACCSKEKNFSGSISLPCDMRCARAI